ncbi:hypothetical protein SAMN05445060_2742 [Williamsia sterculiae]|uniref:Uncharacterized protein n=1 Tax=Williamsia sterculiae TaxID=1344003 RepID=A0A1N7GFY1_9NOCA|nr:hypothetical protein SAMN05445060_2742 [Williamsia sterculiae]
MHNVGLTPQKEACQRKLTRSSYNWDGEITISKLRQ